MSWVSYFPPKAFNFYTFRLSFFCFWIVGNGKQWGGSSSKMVRFLNNNSGFFEAANCQAKGGWNKMNHFLSGISYAAYRLYTAAVDFLGRFLCCRAGIESAFHFILFSFANHSCNLSITLLCHLISGRVEDRF